ncbi:hypothetical protein J2129_001618 [Methanofollis sp. W23]|nr:hypothetical protein [Methanofollis sp. W23]
MVGFWLCRIGHDPLAHAYGMKIFRHLLSLFLREENRGGIVFHRRPHHSSVRGGSGERHAPPVRDGGEDSTMGGGTSDRRAFPHRHAGRRAPGTPRMAIEVGRQNADHAEDDSVICISSSTRYGWFKFSCKPGKIIVRIIFMVNPLDSSLRWGARRLPHPPRHDRSWTAIPSLWSFFVPS